MIDCSWRRMKKTKKSVLNDWNIELAVRELYDYNVSETLSDYSCIHIERLDGTGDVGRWISLGNRINRLSISKPHAGLSFQRWQFDAYFYPPTQYLGDGAKRILPISIE